MANPRLQRLAQELDVIARNVSDRAPSRTSKWYHFAQKFKLSVPDLNEIAKDLGHRRFRQLEQQGTPKELYDIAGERAFFKALRGASLVAYGMNNNPLRRAIQGLRT